MYLVPPPPRYTRSTSLSGATLVDVVCTLSHTDTRGYTRIYTRVHSTYTRPNVIVYFVSLTTPTFLGLVFLDHRFLFFVRVRVLDKVSSWVRKDEDSPLRSPQPGTPRVRPRSFLQVSRLVPLPSDPPRSLVHGSFVCAHTHIRTHAYIDIRLHTPVYIHILVHVPPHTHLYTYPHPLVHVCLFLFGVV